MTREEALEILAATFAYKEPSPDELADFVDDIVERYGLSDEDCEMLAVTLDDIMRGHEGWAALDATKH
jgi:hypothetical protein